MILRILTLPLCLLLFLLSIKSNRCAAQTYSSLIADQEVYSFLSSIQSTDTARFILNKVIIPWDPLQLLHGTDDSATTDFDRYFYNYMYLYKGRADTMFSTVEKSHFYKQFTVLRDSIWRQPFGGGKLVEIINPVLQLSKSYSVPLFSKDGSYALVRQALMGAPAGGRGGVFVYRRREEGSWELVDILNKWER